MKETQDAIARLEELAIAALAYDTAIQRAAIIKRTAIKSTPWVGAWVGGDELDTLYATWLSLARKALRLIMSEKPVEDEGLKVSACCCAAAVAMTASKRGEENVPHCMDEECHGRQLVPKASA